ncbi:A24 family peptidase [uncultured Helicobacter sp.]|uniref:prepilin peptidase n=1 Tax=uncultured Helicobacter sp. TaxID=175537 RepID=UPI002612153E|nr:A24 family peptidase [uncultured Helicobacter sp.]
MGWLEGVLIFCFGLSFGSFANVLIYRIPRSLNLVFPDSFCPHCQTRLKWRDKIPLLSYLLYLAKCRYCNLKIPFYYFLSEVLGGILAVSCYAWLGIFGILLFGLLLCFYVLSVIDWEFLAIPNSLNFLNLAFGISYGAATLPPNLLGISWAESLLFATCFMGFASFLRLFLGSITNKEVLGEGDIIVFGTLGAGLGGFGGILAIFFGSTTALLTLLFLKFRDYQALQIPFVPFLFFGFICVILCQFFGLF